MSTPLDIQTLEVLIANGYTVPGFALVRDPYNQVGTDIVQRISFLIGDPGRTPEEDYELKTLIKALKYVGIETGWEPVPIDKDLQRKNKLSFDELVEYKDASIRAAMSVLNDIEDMPISEKVTVSVKAVYAYLMQALYGKH